MLHRAGPLRGGGGGGGGGGGRADGLNRPFGEWCRMCVWYGHCGIGDGRILHRGTEGKDVPEEEVERVVGIGARTSGVSVALEKKKGRTNSRV